LLLIRNSTGAGSRRTITGIYGRTVLTVAKEFARKFYSSKAWQECRNEYMKRAHYLCENCLRKGIYKPAEIVHHIIEIDPITIERPEIALNFDNLEAVCRACHDELHDNRGRWAEVNRKRRETRDASNRYVVGENGKIFSQ
jgi:5-methylcytosine-specific restriction endonuclease McrA